MNDEIGEKGLEQALLDYGEDGEKTVELLKSKKLAEYMCGLGKLQLFVNDGGHTNVNRAQLANAESDEFKQAMNKINEDIEPIYRNIKAEYDKLEEKWTFYRARVKIRDDAYKKEKYIKEGDTAVYVLDSFMGFDMDKWKNYYEGDGDIPTILTMKDDDIINIDACLKDADSDPRIKNFIFDCSNNLGGSLDEVAMLYSMITGNRETTFYMDDALTGQKISETYEADLNFDKKFDDEDNRDPYDLKFAVITSSSSFSCGNIFPSVMKDVVIDDEGNKGEMRIPDYSDFYNIQRLSEELKKLD